ncbi:hypothetical protein B0T16DRAFT_507754 [Cercophora newfieldiana]|uniref:SKP1 component POZ domain-containing protein n=1 Tax=Cercophora newfieldiana TaxID=92897 RepID=A0AA39YAR7_9PEZI|nr:hypothetical protein B0T16DRAFT_507754 [Cercophora newfieldiana]
MTDSKVKITNTASPSGTVFEISRAGAAKSAVIDDIAKLLFDDGDISEVIPIQISGVGDDTLGQVLAWMDLEALSTADALVQPMSLINDSDKLFEICNVANYLCADGVLSVVIKRIARIMSGKNVVEMRELLGYETPENDGSAMDMD